MMTGVLPSFEVSVPQGGMLGVVLVHPMNATPARAACQP